MEQWSTPLCGSIDAAQQVVLGFLKYIFDAFEERQVALLAEWGEDAAEGLRRVDGRRHLLGDARGPVEACEGPGRQSTVGLTVDAAMAAIERHNFALAHVLPPRPRLRPPHPRQAEPRPAGRPRQQHPGRQRARPLPRRARPRLRGTSRIALRERQGRGVLHAALRVRVLVEMLKPYRSQSTIRAAARQVCRAADHVRLGRCHRQRDTAARRKPTPPALPQSCGRQEPWRPRGLRRRGLLSQVVQRFGHPKVDLHPDAVDNATRRPADVGRLLVDLLLAGDRRRLRTKAVVLSVYDPCCSCGGNAHHRQGARQRAGARDGSPAPRP